jgi:hypothetical protein
MSPFGRRVAVAGVAALALGVVAGSTTATAVPTAPPSYITSWLALHTGSSSSVTLVSADGTRSAPQVLTTGKACVLDEGSRALLDFGGSGLGPGLSNGGIGIREKRNASGTSCAAVDAASDETLVVALGGGVVAGDLVAAAASLDIDLKQSAQILAVAYQDGTETGRFELRSGASIDAPLPTPGGPVPDDNVFVCNNPADSGPDSGINNNCRWEISAPSWTRTKADETPGLSEDGVVFDTLTLKPVTGSFSLMGGADGPVADPDYPMPSYFGADASASILELVDGVVDCSEGTNTVTLRGDIPSSWKRLVNVGGTEESCLAYPYATRTGIDEDGRQFAEMVKPLDFETKAQALWSTTFFVGGGNAVPPITMELDKLDGTQLVYAELGACPAEYYADPAAFDPEAEGYGYPYACLVSAERGSGKLNKYATYTAYVFGDAGMRR